MQLDFRICFLIATGFAALCTSNAQTGPGDLVWSCGFESADGFTADQTAAGAIVSVLGGTAVIVPGEAAEGGQFVRFTPQATENALILKLGGQVVNNARGRRIEFAARLVGDSTDTRLILSRGQTLALVPKQGAIELEVAGAQSRRLAVALTSAGWVTIGVEERSDRNSWNLYVGGVLAAPDLPLQDNAQLFSDLLVFADGVLDLDAVRVSSGSDIVSVESTAAVSRTTSDGDTSVDSETIGRGLGLAEAMDKARREDFVGSVSAANRISKRGRTLAEQDSETGQMFALMAFALRDEGRYRAARVLARQALQQLSQASSRAAAEGTPAARRATHDFVAAQVAEGVLLDEKEAERLFSMAAELDPGHRGAKKNKERLREKLHRQPGDAAGKNGGGR